ncbi:MAG: hypothetical protein JWM53_5375 [bacterium]|nr:hypothetical protein [bacterium]
MTATTAKMTLHALPTISAPSPAAARGAVLGAPLALLRLEGAAALAGACYAYAALGGRWSMFALLFLLPDLSMLGYLASRRLGAASYNAAHSYLGPALLVALGVACSAHGIVAIASIWAAHVGFDRLLGYGLKYGTSFGDTHLGHRGNAARGAR